jgi:hypothetical protein
VVACTVVIPFRSKLAPSSECLGLLEDSNPARWTRNARPSRGGGFTPSRLRHTAEVRNGLRQRHVGIPVTPGYEGGGTNRGRALLTDSRRIVPKVAGPLPTTNRHRPPPLGEPRGGSSPLIRIDGAGSEVRTERRIPVASLPHRQPDPGRVGLTPSKGRACTRSVDQSQEPPCRGTPEASPLLRIGRSPPFGECSRAGVGDTPSTT